MPSHRMTRMRRLLLVNQAHGLVNALAAIHRRAMIDEDATRRRRVLRLQAKALRRFRRRKALINEYRYA